MLSASPFFTRAGVSTWYWWNAATTWVWSMRIMVVIDGDILLSMEAMVGSPEVRRSGDLGHRRVFRFVGLVDIVAGAVGPLDQLGHRLRRAVPRGARDRLRQFGRMGRPLLGRAGQDGLAGG